MGGTLDIMHQRSSQWILQPKQRWRRGEEGIATTKASNQNVKAPLLFNRMRMRHYDSMAIPADVKLIYSSTLDQVFACVVPRPVFLSGIFLSLSCGAIGCRFCLHLKGQPKHWGDYIQSETPGSTRMFRL